MVGAEIPLVYDPTPATRMWYWDNDIKEDAHSAVLDVSYQKFTTTTDANIGFNEYGVFVFPKVPPADIWTAKSRIIPTNEGGFG